MKLSRIEIAHHASWPRAAACAGRITVSPSHNVERGGGLLYPKLARSLDAGGEAPDH